MIKTGNSSITSADKEKCLAVVKRHAPEVAASTVAMETEESQNEKYQDISPLQLTDKTKSTGVNVAVIDLTEDSRRKAAVKLGQTQTHTKVKFESETAVKAETNVESKTVTVKTHETHEGGESVMFDHVNVKKEKSENGNIPVAMDAESNTSTTGSSVVVKVEGSTDITKPLTINTKFISSPGPSSESTDTASEVGSCFSSPSSSTLGNSAQNSPNVPISEKGPGK